jgi:hypothetical protein
MACCGPFNGIILGYFLNISKFTGGVIGVVWLYLMLEALF